jgi:hypothetical protein
VVDEAAAFRTERLGGRPAPSEGVGRGFAYFCGLGVVPVALRRRLEARADGPASGASASEGGSFGSGSWRMLSPVSFLKLSFS